MEEHVESVIDAIDNLLAQTAHTNRPASILHPQVEPAIDHPSLSDAIAIPALYAAVTPTLSDNMLFVQNQEAASVHVLRQGSQEAELARALEALSAAGFQQPLRGIVLHQRMSAPDGSSGMIGNNFHPSTTGGTFGTQDMYTTTEQADIVSEKFAFDGLELPSNTMHAIMDGMEVHIPPPLFQVPASSIAQEEKWKKYAQKRVAGRGVPAAVLKQSYKCLQPNCNALKITCRDTMHAGPRGPLHLEFYGVHNHAVSETLKADHLSELATFDPTYIGGRRKRARHSASCLS